MTTINEAIASLKRAAGVEHATAMNEMLTDAYWADAKAESDAATAALLAAIAVEVARARAEEREACALAVCKYVGRCNSGRCPCHVVRAGAAIRGQP